MLCKACIMTVANRNWYLCFRMDDILPGPVSQAVIVDNSYHVSSDVWEGVERGPIECMSSNRSLGNWVLSDAQKEILHMVGFGVFANPAIVL